MDEAQPTKTRPIVELSSGGAWWKCVCVLQSRMTNTIYANDNVNSRGTERRTITELKKKPIAV